MRCPKNIENPDLEAQRKRGRESGFTLIEVIIAAGILFSCLFVILALLANSLRSARALQHKSLDAGMAAAQLSVELTATNSVSEGSYSGDFGDLYPGARYTYDLQEVGTNGFCQVDIVVKERGHETESKMSMLLYLPNLKKK